jgi:hypothetical protein
MAKQQVVHHTYSITLLGEWMTTCGLTALSLKPGQTILSNIDRDKVTCSRCSNILTRK